MQVCQEEKQQGICYASLCCSWLLRSFAPVCSKEVVAHRGVVRGCYAALRLFAARKLLRIVVSFVVITQLCACLQQGIRSTRPPFVFLIQNKKCVSINFAVTAAV
jgi:hypothetical protein